MAKPADILDPALRKGAEEAERLLDQGEYTKAAHTCAETYLLLLDRRPELIPTSDPLQANPVGQRPTDGGAEGLARWDAARAARQTFWPPQGGIRVVIAPDRKPSLAFEKERFSLSEAASYFEFLVQQLADAQRSPA